MPYYLKDAVGGVKGWSFYQSQQYHPNMFRF